MEGMVMTAKTGLMEQMGLMALMVLMEVHLQTPC
jgi:hypothetical protein